MNWNTAPAGTRVPSGNKSYGSLRGSMLQAAAFSQRLSRTEPLGHGSQAPVANTPPKMWPHG
eukprot:15441355-Alexandrium_andersonii.AAC.1